MFNHGLAVVCVFMMNELSMTRSSKTANVQPRLGRGLRFRKNEQTNATAKPWQSKLINHSTVRA